MSKKTEYGPRQGVIFIVNLTLMEIEILTLQRLQRLSILYQVMYQNAETLTQTAPKKGCIRVVTI